MLRLGDFNYPKINWEEVSCNTEEDIEEALLLEVVRDSYLTQYVKEHTRITANSQPSLLDLLLVSPGVDILDVEYMEPLGKSNHVTINATFNLKCVSTLIQLIKRNYKKSDYYLLNILLDQDWTSLFEHRGMEERWTIFKSKIKQDVSASTSFMKILRGKNKIIIEDTSGHTYQIIERSTETIQRQQI